MFAVSQPTQEFNVDRQAIFNQVRAHLLSQHSRSVIIEAGALPQHRNGAVSAYRGFRNMACAIGAVIPDGVYHPNMEGNPIRRLIAEWPRIQRLFKVEGEEDILFLEALQNVHDTIQPREWDQYLAMTANRFKVEHPDKNLLFREQVREPNHSKRRQ